MKRIDEIWWCGISPKGVLIWTYLDLLKKDVENLLKENIGGDWRSRGWRVAKLRVVEVAQ